MHRLRSEEVLLRVNEQRNILHEIRKRKANWIGHILRRNCLLQQVIEGKIKRQIEVTRRRGRRRKKLLDDLKDRRGYCQLKEEALDRTMWRNCFGRGFGPVVWQITDDDDDDDECTDEWMMAGSEKLAQGNPCLLIKLNDGMFSLGEAEKQWNEITHERRPHSAWLTSWWKCLLVFANTCILQCVKTAEEGKTWNWVLWWKSFNAQFIYNNILVRVLPIQIQNYKIISLPSMFVVGPSFAD